ncbi:MAG: T9SS type A sorting domain-containing protein, partial [Bacteroidota bacterium]
RYSTALSKTICGDPDTLFSSMVDDDFNNASQPQPTIHQGVLFLKISEVSQLQLIDIAGRVICNRQVTPDDAASGIPLDALKQTGIYLLTVSDSNGVRSYRLFVPRW